MTNPIPSLVKRMYFIIIPLAFFVVLGLGLGREEGFASAALRRVAFPSPVSFLEPELWQRFLLL